MTQDGRLDVVANDAGDRTTPAYVGINEGEVLVGASAKLLASRKPTSVVQHNKKILSLNDSEASNCFYYKWGLSYLPTHGPITPSSQMLTYYKYAYVSIVEGNCG